MGDLQVLSKLYFWGALLEDLQGWVTLAVLTWGGQYYMPFWSLGGAVRARFSRENAVTSRRP